MGEHWAALPATPHADVPAARAQVHRGVQWLARMAQSYAEPKTDLSHTSLVWSHEPVTSLVDDPADAGPAMRLSEPFPVQTPVVSETLTAAYVPGAHRIWLGRPERPNNVILLEGRSDAELETVVRGALGSLGADADRFVTALDYEDQLPAAPDAPPAPEAIAELSAAYANADIALQPIAAQEPGASPVRLWPEHFDIATLIALDPSAPPPGGEARTIGVGFSPGDGSHDRPYLYVTPWPYPPREALGAPPEPWAWHTEGFTALTTPAFAVMHEGETAARAALRAGIARCRVLLELGESS